jgi:hypothetical protein
MFRQPTMGDAIWRCENLLLTCADCKPAGTKVAALEFATWHNLPRAMTLWAVAQRLRCGACGSRTVSLTVEPPHPYGHAYRMARRNLIR